MFSLNLDPNGTSYWAGDFISSNVYKVNIGTGAVETSFNTLTGPDTVFGICLKGELTAGGGGGGVGRMTGGGSISGSPAVRHGFELHCNSSTSPDKLQVNWAKTNKFHLETLTSAVCSDDPTITPNPPAAGFDTYKGVGTGRFNGTPGYNIKFTFTDAGEPGVNDTAEIEIKDPTDYHTLGLGLAPERQSPSPPITTPWGGDRVSSPTRSPDCRLAPPVSQ